MGQGVWDVVDTPRADTPPGQNTSPRETANETDGTHPTGMHSCFTYFYLGWWNIVQSENDTPAVQSAYTPLWMSSLKCALSGVYSVTYIISAFTIKQWLILLTLSIFATLYTIEVALHQAKTRIQLFVPLSALAHSYEILNYCNFKHFVFFIETCMKQEAGKAQALVGKKMLGENTKTKPILFKSVF